MISVFKKIQFWPAFIVALPATTVVAGISTLIIANNVKDSPVSDNYYKEGLAINQELSRRETAEKYALCFYFE